MDNDQITVWRLQVNTGANNDINIGEYCYDNDVAAMGWSYGESAARNSIKSFEDFEKFLENEDGSKPNPSIRRLAKEVRENDIIWMRYGGVYYFARVTGNSKYRFDLSEESKGMDASNQLTDLKWIRATDHGDISSVPGALVTGFIRGTTFQRINKPMISEFSQGLYNLRGAEVGDSFKYPQPKLMLSQDDFYSLLQPDDVEDLLAVWLFDQYGYICIPSSCKKDTQTYEYILLDPSSKQRRHIYNQVKKGNVDLNGEDYKKLKGTTYLVTTDGKVTNEDACPDVVVVDPKTLYEFAIDEQKQHLVPASISHWVEFLSQTEDSNRDENAVKGIMFDTNLTYSETNEMDMLSANRVCGYGDAKRYAKSFRKGDYVFYYSAGKGICAAGRIASEKAKNDGDDCLYQDVELIVPKKLPTEFEYVSAREIKDLLNRGFYFASTIKTPFLNEEQSATLLDALKAKYESRQTSTA